MAYHQQGWSARRIALALGLAPRTVSRWLLQGRGPGTVVRRRKPSLLDHYIPSLRRQWKRGQHDPQHLWKNIQAHGYVGSMRNVYRFVATLKAEAPRPKLPSPLTAIAARRVTEWLMRDQNLLSPKDQQQLRQILHRDVVLAEAAPLIAQFRRMVHEHNGTDFEPWLIRIHQAGIPELQRFAQGLERDKAVVQAGLTLPYSTGPVEGHIHRLKLLKRQSYGRAGLPFLARRMMAAA